MERRIRWMILGFCVALFLVVAPIVVLYSIGFRFVGGKLEETGVLLLDSVPAGASVTVNGQPTEHKTPAVIYQPAPGRYTVTVSLKGYRDWIKTFDLVPQRVTRAKNIVLVPAEIEPVLVSNNPLTCFSLSGDGKVLVFADNQSPPGIWLKNVGYDEEPVCVITPGAVDLPKNATIRGIECGTTGRSAILTVAVPEEGDTLRTYWLSLREPYTLTRIDHYVPNPCLYRINPRVPHQVFILSGDRLCRLDVREKTVKLDISQDVETFEVTEDNLWLLKVGRRSVFARPLGSNDPLDDKEIFVVQHASGEGTRARRLAVYGQRNAAIITPFGQVLLRTGPDSSELAPAVVPARMAAFSPDHLRVALGSDYRLSVLQAYPLATPLSETVRPQQEVIEVLAEEQDSQRRITQFFWWSDSSHLLVRSGNTIELLEVEREGGQNRYSILTLKAPESVVMFNPREATIFFTDWRGTDLSGKEGLFLHAAKLRPTPKPLFEWFSKKKPAGGVSTLTRP